MICDWLMCTYRVSGINLIVGVERWKHEIPESKRNFKGKMDMWHKDYNINISHNGLGMTLKSGKSSTNSIDQSHLCDTGSASDYLLNHATHIIIHSMQ